MISDEQFKSLMKLENKTYTPDLADPDSPAYKALEAEFCAQVSIHTEVVLEMLAEREGRWWWWGGGVADREGDRETERQRESTGARLQSIRLKPP